MWVLASRVQWRPLSSIDKDWSVPCSMWRNFAVDSCAQEPFIIMIKIDTYNVTRSSLCNINGTLTFKYLKIFTCIYELLLSKYEIKTGEPVDTSLRSEIYQSTLILIRWHSHYLISIRFLKSQKPDVKQQHFVLGYINACNSMLVVTPSIYSDAV